MNRNCYGVMIKYPEPGRVKTRLAADLGPEKAVLISRQVTERVIGQTAPDTGGYERIVFYDPPERRQDFRSWLPDENFSVQKGRDVGERMDNALRYLLENGAEKAVITGADIPDLDSGIISQAFELLDHADVVIGPARDGGYYLIGIKTPMPELFRNIHWSTGDVFTETVSVLKSLCKSFEVLPVLSDLDTIDDLAHFGR